MSGTKIIQPEIQLTLENATRVVSNTDQKVLLVGQKTVSGSATSGILVQNLSSIGAPENALFGQSSTLAEMVRAFKRVNEVVQVDCIPLDDASGTPRALTFTVLGTATGTGTITVVAGSEVQYSFDIAITVGNTATNIADLITSTINADGNCPFTVSNVAGLVTLTADNDGTVANDLGVEVVLTDAAGITISVALADTPGATDPTLTSVLDVAIERYQAIVWPYADVSDLVTFLDARFNNAGVILDGVGVVTTQDSVSGHVTALNLLNSESLVVFADKTEGETNYIGPSQNEASYAKSAMFAGIRALRLTQDASISQFLTSTASLDQFGSSALASLPFFNTPMPDLPVIKAGRGWTAANIVSLFAAGGSVMGVNFSGTSALAGEVVTTYKTDAASNVDPTFQFLNYVDTSSNVREYFWNNLKARFAQSRLTAGVISRGRDMANAVVIQAYVEKLYQDLAGANFVLVQDGEAAIKFFKDNLSVVLDLVLGKATITMLVPIVTQLRTIIGTVKITFSTE